MAAFKKAIAIAFVVALSCTLASAQFVELRERLKWIPESARPQAEALLAAAEANFRKDQEARKAARAAGKGYVKVDSVSAASMELPEIIKEHPLTKIITAGHMGLSTEDRDALAGLSRSAADSAGITEAVAKVLARDEL